MNIFDFRGPEFLTVFVQAELVGIIAAIVGRNIILSSGSKGSEPAMHFDHYDAAYLKGGEEHVFLTAIATMAHRRKIEVNASDRTVTGKEALDGKAHAVERVIESAVWHKSTSLKSVFECVEPTLQKMRSKLAHAGLAPSRSQDGAARMIAAAFVAAPVICLAVPKIGIGLSHGKPIGILLVLALISGAIALWCLRLRAYATSKGERQLADWQKESGALRSNLCTNPHGMNAADIAMAYALFGALSVGMVDPYNAARGALRPQSTGGGGCGGGSCGGGGGCGGGGCGGCGG